MAEDIRSFYRIYAEKAEEYAEPGKGLQVLERGCAQSEFQFLDHQPITIPLSENSGLEFPDFLYARQIPLISDRFKAVLDNAGVDNLFYKAVILTDTGLGIKERYWLAQPPRIRCLNRQESRFVQENVSLPKATKIVINPSKVGNYKVFCIGEVVNREIIVTEELKEEIEKARLENVFFDILEG